MTIFQINEAISPIYGHAFTPALSMQDLQHRAPAIFAETASSMTKPTYRFINTAEVVGALKEAGFEPSSAQQTRSRHPIRINHSRHMIRLRPMRQTITLFDCIPEICLVNAHDGTSAYIMLNLACHHRRDSTCYPAYLQLNPRRGTMVTFSEELTVRNGEAGAHDHLILRDRCRRQGAPLLTRCARCGRPAATALMLLMPEPVNAWI